MDKNNKIIISHRANLDGPHSALYGENHPDSIKAALNAGFDAEIDLRIINSKWYLGHDEPEYEVDSEFLFDDRLWVHCKNLETLSEAIWIVSLYANIFFHQNDDGVLTSTGFIFTAPGKEITPLSIAALPELIDGWDVSEAAGICTDYPRRYQ